MQIVRRLARTPSAEAAALAVGEGALFVSDALITRIGVFSFGGESLRSVELDPTLSPARRPSDIWMTHVAGQLHLVAKGGDRVVVLRDDGSTMQVFWTAGQTVAKGEADGPITLTSRQGVEAMGYVSGRLLLRVHELPEHSPELPGPDRSNNPFVRRGMVLARQDALNAEPDAPQSDKEDAESEEDDSESD